MNLFCTRMLIAALFCSVLAISNPLSAQCTGTEVETVITINPSGFSEEISWELYDNSSATLVASTSCGDYTDGLASSDTFCLTVGSSYSLKAFDDWGDGWNGGTYAVTVGGTLISTGSPNDGISGDNSAGCDGSAEELSYTFAPGGPVSGCTDPTAINYNPAATVDDGSCIYPATNDECADAIELSIDSCFTGNNINATFSADQGLVDASLSCAGVSLDGTVADIWFKIDIPANGVVDVQLISVPGITATMLFSTGSCDSLYPLPGIPCANYGAGNGITLTGLNPDSTLYIRFWDFASDDFGGYEICLSSPLAGCTDPCSGDYDSLATIDDGSCGNYPLGQGSDLCAVATILPGPGTFGHYNGGASGDDISSCVTGDSADIWFAYTVGTGLDSLRIYTCGSNYDTGLSLWDDCDATTATEIACDDDGAVGGGDACGGASFQSLIELNGTDLDDLEGTTILIRIAGFDGSTGCGDLVIEEVEGAADCSAATIVENFQGVVTPSLLSLSWDPIPTSVGCQVSYGPAGAGFAGVQSIFGFELTGANVPIAFIPSGTYQLRVRCGCQILPSIIATAYSGTILVTVPEPKLADSSQDDLALNVSPNPARDFLGINFRTDAEQAVTLSIVNILGSEELSQSYEANAGINYIELNTSELGSGLYIVTLQGGLELISTQFEIVR